MFFVFLLLVTVFSPVWSVFRLQPGAFLKLPDHQGRTSYDNGAASKASYDAQENYLYVIGYEDNVLHVVDMTDPANPTLLTTKPFSYVNHGQPDSIQVCRGAFPELEFLAISYEAPHQNEKGHVHIYQLLNASTVQNNLVRIKDMAILDAYDPRAMAWTHDCMQLVVLSEGNPHELNGVFEDPLGSVEILIPRDSTSITKQSVAIHENYLEAAGIRQAFTSCDSVTGDNPMPPPSSRKQDLEPKAVTVDRNNNAYVVFQENNALGKFNTLAASPEVQFFDLGTKEWRQFALDGSYDDQAIALESRPGLRSLYQPSSVVNFELEGKTWLATADQGSLRKYTLDTCRYDESIEARHWNQGFTDVLPEMEQTKLNADMKSVGEIGRLRVSKLKIPNDGWDNFWRAYDYVTAFGGRSFSIYDADNMNRIYNSGDFFERYFVNGSATQEEDSMFNAKVGSASSSQSSQRDRASPEMGAAPSAIAVADWSSTMKVLLIANGVHGGLYVYSVAAGPIEPVVNFESFIRRGDPGMSWRGAYDAEGDGVGEPDISDLLYIDDQGHKTVVALSRKAASLSFYMLVQE